MEKRIQPQKGGAALLLGILLPNIVGSIVLVIAAAVISATSGKSLADVLSSDPITFIGLVLTQGLMLVPVLIFTGCGKDFRSSCNLKTPQKKLDLLVAAVIAVGEIFGLTVLTSLFFAFLGIFGYTPTESPFPDMTITKNFVVSIFIVALLPAFCEEMLFRGVIFNSLLQKGKWFAIVFSAVFFMLMHASPLQTIYQLALGVILALVVYKSGSILTGMLIHFLNNFIAIFIEYLGYGDMEFPWYLTVIGLLLVGGGLFYFLKKPDPKVEFETPETEEVEERLADADRIDELLKDERRRTKRIDKILAYIFFGISAAFCVVVWITQFIQGLSV